MNDRIVLTSELIINIPHELFTPSNFQRFDGFFDMEKINLHDNEYQLKDSVHYVIDITNTGEGLLVRGNAEVIAITACSRCLEDVEIKLNATIETYLLLEEPKEITFDTMNEFEVLPADHKIDIFPLIMSAFLADAPERSLCKPDCKGLCINCGRNLNHEKCICGEDINYDSNNPFAALKDLKIDNS